MPVLRFNATPAPGNLGTNAGRKALAADITAKPPTVETRGAEEARLRHVAREMIGEQREYLRETEAVAA